MIYFFRALFHGSLFMVNYWDDVKAVPHKPGTAFLLPKTFNAGILSISMTAQHANLSQ